MIEPLQDSLSYKDGYKHQTVEDISFMTDIFPSEDIVFTQYGTSIRLNTDGYLIIEAGFVYDGASGPTWDSSKEKRASCFHDAIYKLFRNEMLDRRRWREHADKGFYDLLIMDGLWFARARVWYRMVRVFAKKATLRARKIHIAPKRRSKA